MDPIAVRQHEKIFKLGEVPHNKSSQSIVSTADRLHSTLARSVRKLMTLKIGDEEFDDPQINLDSLDSYSTELLYGVLSKKFGRMVQILQEDEDQLEELAKVNEQLKQTLAEMEKYSEESTKQARQELEQLLDANAQIINQNNLGKVDIQNLQTLLLQKDEEIHKLKVSQMKAMDDFIQMRESQQQMNAKSNELKDTITDMRKNLENSEIQIAEFEKTVFEKQKELENLMKQRKVQETKLKQNTLKLSSLLSDIKKKGSEQDKTMDEYRRKLEKNSVFVKRLAEIEKEKEELNEEMALKTAELNQVRAINEDYEYRMEQLKGIENYIGNERNRHYKLLAEQEQMKQDINELAPHSLLDVTPQHLDSKRSLPKFETHEKSPAAADEEREGNVAFENLEEEIGFYKQQMAQFQQKIDELEAENNEKITTINGQRKLTNDLHAEYTDKIQTFNLVKAECEDALIECNQLENEMELLMKKFDLLSEILNRNNAQQGGQQMSGQKPQIPRFHEEEIDTAKTTFGQEDLSPKPDQLNVSPSERDKMRSRKEIQPEPDVEDYEEESNETPMSYLQRGPQPQKPEIQPTKKSPGSKKR